MGGNWFGSPIKINRWMLFRLIARKSVANRFKSIMEHSSIIIVLKSRASFPPLRFKVKLSLIQPFCAKKEWIVEADLPVWTLIRSAALPVGANNWKLVPLPWTRSILSRIARITVVFPVPALPEITHNGLVKIFMQMAAWLSKTFSYSSGQFFSSGESVIFKLFLNLSGEMTSLGWISALSAREVKTSSIVRSSSKVSFKYK